MKRNDNSTSNAAELRHQAEERLMERQRSRKPDEPREVAEAHKLIQELQIHQIELEMQNEELQKSRTEVEELLNQYSDLYDFAPAGYFTFDREGAIRRVNLTGATLLGTERARLVNRRFGQFVSEADRPVFNHFLKTVFTKKASVSGKASCEVALSEQRDLIPLRDTAGSRDAVEATRRNVYIEGTVTENGQECRVVMTDITSRKQAEEKIINSEAFLNRMIEQSPTAMWISDDQGNLIRLNQACCNLLKITADEVVCRYNIFQDNIVKGQGLLPLVKAVFECGETAHFEIDYNSSHVEGLKLQRTVAVILDTTIFPIKDTYGRITHAVIQHNNVTEHKQTEDALKISEKKYRMLHESMMDGFVSVRMDGKFLECNEIYRNMLGYSETELASLSYVDLTPEKWHAYEADIVQNQILKRGYSDVYEKEYLRKDGTIFPVELHTVLIRDEQGNPAIMWAIARDITERKRVEGALREIDEGLRMAQRLSNIGSWKWIVGTDTVQWSEELYRINHHDKTLPVPSFAEMSSFYTSGSWERLKETVASALRSGESYEIDLDLVRTDGTIRNTVARGAVDFDTTGEIVSLHGTVQDITERKRAEEELRKSEENYRGLFQNASIGIFHSRPEGQFLRVNPALARMMGYVSPEEMISSITNIGTQIYVDSKKRSTLIAKTTEHTDWVYAENRYRRKDGTLLTANLTVRKVLNPDSTLAYLEGFVEDITERKQAEEELKKKESYNYALFEYNPEQAIAVDLEGKVIAINRAKRISGDRLPKIGDVMYRDYASSHEIDMYAELMECLGSGKLKVFPEQKYREKILSLSIAPFTAGAVIISHDITERKQREVALCINEKEAKHLAQEAEIIAEIGQLISSTLNIEEVYEPFAAMVKKIIPYDRIAINTIILKDHTRTVRHLTGNKITDNLIGEVRPLAGTGVELALRLKSCLLINSNKEEMRKKYPGLSSLPANSQTTMIIPLISKDEVIGTLSFHCAMIKEYSKKDLLLAERVGTQIAGAIVNAQLFLERKQAGEQLQKALDSLRNAVNTTIQVMVSTVEARDPYTAGHQLKSANLARAIATEMGLSQDKIESIRMAGSIHDIGKISIPAEILSKPTKLSEIEFSLIKEHARKGFEMLKDVESPWPLAEIVYQHHERIDGSGYPRNLKGEDICIEARILSVSDVVEAMASHRPYRAGLGIEAALHEIEQNKGIFYDNTVADACLRLFREKGFQLVEA